MTVGFRKRIRLFPGAWINMSKRWLPRLAGQARQALPIGGRSLAAIRTEVHRSRVTKAP